MDAVYQFDQALGLGSCRNSVPGTFQLISNTLSSNCSRFLLLAIGASVLPSTDSARLLQLLLQDLEVLELELTSEPMIPAPPQKKCPGPHRS